MSLPREGAGQPILKQAPRRARLRAGALALLLLAASPAWAGERYTVTSSLSATEVPAGGTFDLKAKFAIAPGVHLYKDTITFTWDTLTGAKQQAILLPKGATFPDLASVVPGATTEGYEGTVEATVRFQATGAPGDTIVIQGSVECRGCSENVCFAPKRTPIAHELTIVPGEGAAPPPEEPTPAAPTVEETPAPPAADRLSDTGSLGFLLLAFLAGLGISFTPCVYPMIPITLAIVGGKEQRRKAEAIALSALYVLGIAITYAALGVLVASLGASVRLAFTSPYLLVPIGALFVVLALAMFDVITVQTPAALSGLLDKLGQKRVGVLGVVLLGMASGLVAGPCVAAPLLGVLTHIAKVGDRLLGGLAMFVLAWGMGLILIVAGASTGLLPKAGAWMEWVKRLFGFVLLWAAVYFVRPVVGEAVFYLGTAGVLLAGAVFLGGLDALTAESGFAARVKRLAGLVAVLAAVAFTLMGLGETGALRLGAAREDEVFTYGDAAAVDAALDAGQPVLLDFTASWCSYCKVLDRTTFADPAVVRELGRFRAFKIDVSRPGQNADLAVRYEVAGPPLIAVHDSKGSLLRKLAYEDAKDPAAFAAFLERVE